MTKNEYVILVNENGQQTGYEEKLKAHKEALLHRAFSIVIYNSKGQMLIHKRASAKYHSADLWTNACCSHPRPSETFEAATQRRMLEELGFTISLTEIGDFVYKHHDKQSGLTEYEHDTVFEGFYDGEININPKEMSEFKWIGLAELKEKVQTDPEHFTFWFKKIIELYLD